MSKEQAPISKEKGSEEEEEEEEKEDEETFLQKYKLSGEVAKKIAYSHEIFKPSTGVRWEEAKSFKERVEKQKT